MIQEDRLAQNFRRYKESAIGTAATDIPNGSNFDSYDTIVGISLANILTTAINVDVYIANGGTNYYLVKTAPIPSGGALQVLDGGAKIVVESGDRLYIKSDTASSVDAWVSAVDAISTQEFILGYVGNSPALKYTSFAVQHFTTSATTGYTLDHAVTNENDIRLVINNVVQQPGGSYAYTATGTTLTLSAATAGTDTMYCVFLGKAVQTVTPGQGSVGADELSANAITGQTALGAEPADTDEFIISDSGVLKRVDYSYLKASTTDEFRPNSQALIINGSMNVSQRSTSVASITTSGYNTVDRWNTTIYTCGTWTQTQESLSTADLNTTGHKKSLKMDCTTADASPAAGDAIHLQTRLEAQDCQLFKYGTAGAEKLTLSFWVKATKTGTNIVEAYQFDDDRICCQSYTVDTTNTWEQKVLNFPVDTTGVIDDNNGAGISFNFYMAAGTDYTSGTLQTTWAARTDANRAVGQVNNADSTSNNFEITGVQLEVGEYTSSTLPPFQHESYGENLARCQRYYWNTVGAAYSGGGQGVCGSATQAQCIIECPVSMRANPTGSIVGSGGVELFDGGASPVFQ